MNCLRCGGELGPTERLNMPFRSLPGVLLVGLEGRRCSSCGDVEYEIPRIEELIRVLSEMILRKTARLTGDEIRFLRKALGWSGKDLAAKLGVRPETVSRWEAGVVAIGGTPDRLLRMFVAYLHPVQDYSLEQMNVFASAAPVPFLGAMEIYEQSWVNRGAPGAFTSSVVVARQLETLRAVR